MRRLPQLPTLCLFPILVGLSCQPGDGHLGSTTEEGALTHEVPPAMDIATEHRAKTAEMRVAPRLNPGRLEVRLPNRTELLQSAVLTSGTGWYAASMTVDRHNVFVQGSRAAFAIESIARPSEPLSEAPSPTLTRADGIATLSFVDGGTAYTISVECEAPDDDPRCVHDDYIVGLAEDMGLEVSP